MTILYAGSFYFLKPVKITQMISHTEDFFGHSPSPSLKNLFRQVTLTLPPPTLYLLYEDNRDKPTGLL